MNGRGNEEFLKLVRNEANFLDGYFTRNDFDGYAINSLPKNSILLGAAKRSRILGVTIRQAFRLSPINFRPLFGPRDKTRNPQTMVTLARAYLKLSCEYGDEAYVKGLRLLDWVEHNRSPRFTNFCLPQMKPLFVSSYTASREDIAPLHTCYAGKLFLEHYERTGSEKYLELARSAAGYFVDNHPREESPQGVYFQYVPGMEKKIYNSSAEISAFLVQVAEATDETFLSDLGMAGLSYISSVQNQDGSWFYGNTKSSKYIDNFHSAYVLQAIFDALKAKKNLTLQNSFDKGLSYYCNNLFMPLPGGGLRPRHFDPRYLPRNSNLIQKVDLRDAANAMILFSSLSEVTNRFDNRISEIAHWTASHMRSRQGYCPEITWLWRNGIGYLDVVSWYFLALAHCARSSQIGQ